MRSIFVSFYNAYPPVSGAASVTWNCARHSKGEVTLIQLGDGSREESVESVRVITLAGHGRGFAKLLTIRRLVGEIVDCCRAVDPEVIVLEGASWALYHEMLLRAIRKASLRARVWYHSHNVERLLRRSRNGRAIAAVTGWAEGRLLRCADRSFAVSPVDQRHFRELYGVETSLWPNGVDVASFDTVTPQQTQAIKLKYGLHDQLVLFMGLYAYPPNTKAVEFLVKDVFPEVLLQLPDARLVVIGGVVPFRLPWLVNPGIIPHQELPAFIRACDAGVAPLFAGSGTRLKILEYMAARLPVVATTKAAEGIDAKAGAEILIADDAASFAACVAEAAGKSERASAIGDGGYRLVCDRYDWRKITCNRS